MPLRTIGPWFLLTCACLWPQNARAGDWPQFRGPKSDGTAATDRLPTEWGETAGVVWKTELPGRGLSGPVIIGDRVIVTACSGATQNRLHVLCFDSKSGQPLWERKFWATGQTLCHHAMSVASCTPASDGKSVFALFSSNDLISLDLDGNLRWFRGLNYDYPNACNSLGMASSPLVVGDVLVAQIENDSESFAIGLDTATGENRWKKNRPAVANWTSPVTLPQGAGASDLVLLQGSAGLEAVRPSDGVTVWNFDAKADTIPTCVVADHHILVPSKGLTALEWSATGEPRVLWSENKLAPATASPVAWFGRVFVLNRAGVLNCADAHSGEMLWQLRMSGKFSSTPVIANGYLYLCNDAGVLQVVRNGEDRGELTGSLDLGEPIQCTPAIADSALYVRGDHHLWSIGQRPSP